MVSWGARKVQFRLSALSRFGCNSEFTTSLLREPIHHGQSQPTASLGIFRRIKGFNRALEDIGCHPDPAVFYRQDHKVAVTGRPSV